MMEKYTINTNYITTIAIDHHARSSTLAGLDLMTGEQKTGRISGCPSAAVMLEWAQSWAHEPYRFVYESGPCGFALARDFLALGIRCDIIAVTSIPKSARAKTFKDDHNDAQALLSAILSPKSECRKVYIPTNECEGARELVRAYYDMTSIAQSLKARYQAMLLRHGIVWDKRTKSGNLKATWNREYIHWARSISLEDELQNATLSLYFTETLEQIEKCKQLKSRLIQLAQTKRFKPYVDALTRLKGVDDLCALAFVSTIDDFSRFKNGRSVSAYFGLTPGRHDSGEKRGRGGSMTKAGDSTVRRSVIEGLGSISRYNANHKAQRKGREVSCAIEAEAVKCNARNYARYRDLVKKGKKPNVAKVAVASEVVQQMWVLGTMVDQELG